MRSLQIQYANSISNGVDENDPSLKINNARQLTRDSIPEGENEKDDEFSFQKLRGRALEMEKKTLGDPMRTPNKSIKQPMGDSSKQKEDFSFQTLRAKAVQLESRSNSNENKLDETSTRKATNILSRGKSASVDKKRSEPSSPRPSKSRRSANEKESYTPNRLNKYYKQRINKEEVEATDMSHASVKKLSQWLADNPFEQHKKPVVARKGVHIVTKAKVFEKDYTVTVMAEMNNQYFPTGKVSEGKLWLEKAFKNVDETEQSNAEVLEQFSVSDKAKIFENAFKAKRRSTMSVDTRTLYGDT